MRLRICSRTIFKYGALELAPQVYASGQLFEQDLEALAKICDENMGDG
jgi:hypothetical protein